MTDSHVRYRTLLRSPNTVLLLLAINGSRLSAGLVPYGIIAFYAAQHAYADAGIASATFMIMTALTGPVKGRYVTRLTPRRTLLPLSILFGLSCSAGILLAAAGAPFVLSLALIALGGAAIPPYAAVVRSTWTAIARSSGENKALHTLDSVSEEVVFAVAPVFTSGIWAFFGAMWAVPVGAAVAIAGTIVLLSVGLRKDSPTRSVFADHAQAQARPAAPSSEAKSGGRLYANASVIGLLAPTMGLGVALGALGIALPAWAGEHTADQAISGVLMGIISLSGALVGLTSGRLRFSRLPENRQYQIASTLVVIGMVLFLVSNDVAEAVLAAVVVGAGMTPMFVSSFVLVGDVSASDRHTELNAALGSSYNLGDGVASIVTGALIASIASSGALLVAAVAVFLLCALSVLIRAAKPALVAEDV